MFVSITWEEAILVHLWKQSFITCWSKEQLIGNSFKWCLFPFAPFIKYLLEKGKKKKKRYWCLYCMRIFSPYLANAIHTSVFFCSRYFVIPLWRGSGYTTMFAQGLVFNYWLYIIHAVFIKLCICAEQISFRVVGGVI